MKMFWSLCGILVSLCGTAQAQGLIWSLPQTGQWVRYEGTYFQDVKQATTDASQELKLQWNRSVTLKSLTTETAEFRGKSVPCRWIEIKVEVGIVVGGDGEKKLDIGPGGTQLYKLLVPEAFIRGELHESVVDERKAFVGAIPLVKGTRKSGDKEAVAIEGGVFQLYPVVTLMNHYPELKGGEAAADVTVPAGTFSATTQQGELVIETPTSRSVNTCEVTRSPGIPFGVVKWNASVATETKGATDPRSEFKEFSTIREEMQAVAVGDNAESELN